MRSAVLGDQDVQNLIATSHSSAFEGSEGVFSWSWTGQDFALVNEARGVQAILASQNAVPEPSSIALTALALCIAATGRARRRKALSLSK